MRTPPPSPLRRQPTEFLAARGCRDGDCVIDVEDDVTDEEEVVEEVVEEEEEAIETPFRVYVRVRPLDEQDIGWCGTGSTRSQFKTYFCCLYGNFLVLNSREKLVELV